MDLTKNKKIIIIAITSVICLAIAITTCFNIFALSMSYNRPWNTPERSINGGAQFLAEDYIDEGQYNPYLKRFNVVPSDPRNLYSHQYMTDIRGVAYEALSSYNSFNVNGLLSLPLIFDIPVYLNMKTNYYYPLGGVHVDNTEGANSQSAFANQMRAKGFPDTYIGQLEMLHNKYPNWTFNAVITNLDYETSVNAEKRVSYVDKKTLSDYNYPNPVEGNNWYMASWDTVAFYMDPRNSLDEESILMFYSSKFNDMYTEQTVQTVLNKTFMEGIESKSGKTYAKLFYEAGKTANVNPIYLASLSKHEVGINGSISTSGQLYEYQGMMYFGLYNFFNIGAYSSAENPVLAGLVYANGGSDSSNNAYPVGTPPPTTNPNPDPDPNPGDSFLKGDVNGDGKVSSLDYVAIEKHIMQIKMLSGDVLNRADVNGDGKVSSLDYVAIEKHIMGIKRLF